MSDAVSPNFIVGYKRDPHQEDILWLSSHPDAQDLIFSKNENNAFLFTQEEAATIAMTKILIADNLPSLIPITKQVQPSQQPALIKMQSLSLEQIAANIEELLKLFNQRTNNQLVLFLTLNPDEKSIRGYSSERKQTDALTHFVNLLSVKGMKVKQVSACIFTVFVEPKN